MLFRNPYRKELPLRRNPGIGYLSVLAPLLVCSPLLQAQRNAPYYNANAAALRQKLAEKTTASIQTAFREPDQFSKEAKEAYRSARDRIGLDVSEEISESALLMMCCGLLSKRHTPPLSPPTPKAPPRRSS
ncbi:MAG: hypothetical protein IPK76_01295 [Lewinellaceae bacterium]|nr:hypothetical protein [Lewinellaceae bacterium]